MLISSTGYTGRAATDLCAEPVGQERLDVVFTAGAAYGIKTAGLAARDTLRLRWRCLYGNDIDDTTSPTEGAGWAYHQVHLGLHEQRGAEGGSEQRRSASSSASRWSIRGIPRHGYNIVDCERCDGRWSPGGTQSPRSTRPWHGLCACGVECAHRGNPDDAR